MGSRAAALLRLLLRSIHLNKNINPNIELEKKANKKSNWYDAYNIVMYYKNQINYSIDGYEIYCRALRDKLENISKYEKQAVDLKAPLCEKFWADKRVIHEQLLERLYTYRTGL